MALLTIGQVAAATGVTVEAVRFYERRGLIKQPLKPRGSIRTYPDCTIARIRFIRKAQALGFSLREIDELSSLLRDPNGQCVDVLGRAKLKLAEIEREILLFTRRRELLQKAIDACPAVGPASNCSILKTIEEACIDQK